MAVNKTGKSGKNIWNVLLPKYWS